MTLLPRPFFNEELIEFKLTGTISLNYKAVRVHRPPAQTWHFVPDLVTPEVEPNSLQSC